MNDFANSPLVDTITFRKSSITRMTTTNRYGLLNRLTNTVATPSASGQAPLSFAYSYNSANQRTTATLEDNSYWAYQYDALGQVTDGRKHWYGGTLARGQQFGYAFDDTRPVRYGKLPLCLRSAQPGRPEFLRWAGAGLARAVRSAPVRPGLVDQRQAAVGVGLL